MQHLDRISAAERPHFQQYVNDHAAEYDRDWGADGDAALIIDAAIYADLMAHQPAAARQLFPEVPTMLDYIEVEVTKTANGKYDYVQIRSAGAAIPVNIVLVAKQITVKDAR